MVYDNCCNRIALNLREKGRGENEPGRLKACQGIGWWLEEANIAQISLNLTDMDVTPMHVAYEEAKKDAEELKVAVTGSELVKTTCPILLLFSGMSLGWSGPSQCHACSCRVLHQEGGTDGAR